jgi:hypothetical protein
MGKPQAVCRQIWAKIPQDDSLPPSIQNATPTWAAGILSVADGQASIALVARRMLIKKIGVLAWQDNENITPGCNCMD